MSLRLAISVTIFLLNSYVVSSIFSLNGALVKSSFQHEILHLHRSKGDNTTKTGVSRKIRESWNIFVAVGSFPNRNFLTNQSLGDASKMLNDFRKAA